MNNEQKAIRMCFWCANSHNFTKEVCKCACHPVESLYDELKAINPETEWSIPQLYAIKKLLGDQPAGGKGEKSS